MEWFHYYEYYEHSVEPDWDLLSGTDEQKQEILDFYGFQHELEYAKLEDPTINNREAHRIARIRTCASDDKLAF